MMLTVWLARAVVQSAATLGGDVNGQMDIRLDEPLDHAGAGCRAVSSCIACRKASEKVGKG
jgi:hypothetical protein